MQKSGLIEIILLMCTSAVWGQDLYFLTLSLSGCSVVGVSAAVSDGLASCFYPELP